MADDETRNSILKSVKKLCGLGPDYTPFDTDILFHINSTFARLNQLGIGPDDGFMIEDDVTTWSDYLGDEKRLLNVKSYMYLRVRRLFDPPTTSFVADSIDRQIAEMEWMMNVFREMQAHPVVLVPPELDGGGVETDPTAGWIFDGGGP